MCMSKFQSAGMRHFLSLDNHEFLLEFMVVHATKYLGLHCEGFNYTLELLHWHIAAVLVIHVHNSPICDGQSYSAKILALPWKQGCQFDFKDTTTVWHNSPIYDEYHKLNQQRFWNCHENGHIETIQTIPHNLYVRVKSASLY